MVLVVQQFRTEGVDDQNIMDEKSRNFRNY